MIANRPESTAPGAHTLVEALTKDLGVHDSHTRGRWRERQAWRTGRAGLVSKLATVLTRLVTIPLSLRLLGTERYGLWLTVGSVLAWLAVYDFGLSSGLLNTVAAAYGRGDRPGIRRLVSTAVFGLAAMSAVMVALVVGASHWAGLPRLLGIAAGSPLASDARTLLLVSGGLVAATFTLNNTNQVAVALQEGYLASYSQICAAALSCILLAIASFRGVSMLGFALVMGAPPLVAAGALAGYIFIVRHPAFRPSIREWSFASLRSISSIGTPIFLSQLADIAILYSANLLIANRLGPGLVPAYAIPLSVFMIAGTLCYALAAPYQPAYAEAFARGDFDWIRKTALRVLARNMMLIGVCGLGIVACGAFAIRLWTHSRVTATRPLLCALAVYLMASVWTSTNGIFLIGIGRVKTKAALQACVAAVHVIGTWLLLPQFGIIAVPIAGTAGYLIDVAVSLPLGLRCLSKASAGNPALGDQ